MNNQVGLVLSGGGAKGAYHVGVMQAITELGMPIHQIAGASIGALNGAVLASAPNINVGTERLVELWQHLPQQKPIQLDYQAIKVGLPPIKQTLGYISFLLSAGLSLNNPLVIAKTLSGCVSCENLLKDDILTKMMAEYLDMQQLQTSLPLYVSIFEQNYLNGGIDDFIEGLKDSFKTEVLGIDNQYAEFRHIQSLPFEQQKEMILASSALPLLFKAYQNDNKRYTDGGQGGMIKSQGNTPIQPLIDAGCKHIIVVHLDGQSLWHRYDFPDVTVIEIRPSIDMGGFAKMLDFSENHIEKLIEIGYKDTKQTFAKIQNALGDLRDLRQSTQNLTKIFDNSQTKQLENAMARLRKSKEFLQSLDKLGKS